MNRKNLTAAVLAGLAGAAGIVGSAQAVNINPDGLGQVLIYPYYTVNNKNITLLSVVNTSEEAKAVKVRFTEGQNTREVLDFNLYMSAYDVWTAALSLNTKGKPQMETTDTSCTVPYIYGNGGKQEFLPYAMNDTAAADYNLDRMNEGHFEMIEMGTLLDITEDSATAATHVDGVPADCQQLVDAWTDPDNKVSGDEGYWLGAGYETDLSAPSGGLFGGAAIVNVAKASMVSYDAIALNGFADAVVANDILHQPPGSTYPNLGSGNNYNGYVFLEDGTVQDSGALTRPVDAVSYVFMRDQIMNEYATKGTTLSRTEWVVTFPTKHFYVYEDSSGSPDPIAPFTSVWDKTEENPTACEVVNLDSIWNREEQTIVNPTIPGQPVPPIVSPAPPVIPDPVNPIIPFELCYEVSVISFGAADKVGDQSAMLGSRNFHNIDNTELGFDDGWARLQLDDYPYDYNQDGQVDADEAMFSRASLGDLNGLPVTGFAAETFVNGFLGDEAGQVIANYGALYTHKATRKSGFDSGYSTADYDAAHP